MERLYQLLFHKDYGVEGVPTGDVFFNRQEAELTRI